MTLLQTGDRVRYIKGGRKLHAIVADYIPFRGIKSVPIFKRSEKRVTWMPRAALRKMPNRSK